MTNKKPPFEITNAMIGEIAEIAELVGKLTSSNRISANPTLRRANRIRTIQGSLAIEQNTLSLEQVTAVISGKSLSAASLSVPNNMIVVLGVLFTLVLPIVCVVAGLVICVIRRRR